MHRSFADLVYLVETTTADGNTNHDTALFAEREDRIVEHGWKTERFGETTDRGQELAIGARKFIQERYMYHIEEDEMAEKLDKDRIKDMPISEVIERIESSI